MAAASGKDRCTCRFFGGVVQVTGAKQSGPGKPLAQALPKNTRDEGRPENERKERKNPRSGLINEVDPEGSVEKNKVPRAPLISCRVIRSEPAGNLLLTFPEPDRESSRAATFLALEALRALP